MGMLTFMRVLPEQAPSEATSLRLGSARDRLTVGSNPNALAYARRFRLATDRIGKRASLTQVQMAFPPNRYFTRSLPLAVVFFLLRKVPANESLPRADPRIITGHQLNLLTLVAANL
jgi:hypothetical protein